MSAVNKATAGSSPLQAYSPSLAFTRLTVGVDNIRTDVFLSLRLLEQARQFLFEQILHHAQPHLRDICLSDARKRSAAANEFRQQLGAVLHEALTYAKEQNNIEIDVLARLAIIKWLMAEMPHQFSALTMACQERVEKQRGVRFTTEATTSLLRSKISDYQANRRHIFHAVGENLFQIFEELEETRLRPARLALFGMDFADVYRVLRTGLVFLENPNDAVVHLEQYVMLGHFVNDVDHVGRVCEVLAQLLQEQGLSLPKGDELPRLEQRRLINVTLLQEINHRLRKAERELAEVSRSELRRILSFGWFSGRADRGRAAKRAVLERAVKDLEDQRQRLSREVEELEQQVAFLRQAHARRVDQVLGNPTNADHLFGTLSDSGVPEPRTRSQDAILRSLYRRLERTGMLKHILASYHLKDIYKDFCPPLNPQQLKHAVVERRAWEQLRTLLAQYPAHRFPVEKLEDLARHLRTTSRRRAEPILVRFAHDLMRMRRDFLHLYLLHDLMQKIHLITDEKTRRVSRLNNSLYEFLLLEEREGGEEQVLTHVVIKADVRESTRITEELLRRNLNPATHFSFNFYEPVRKLMARYSASKIFIEGDAFIMAIYETEANRASQRPVAKACLLAKEVVQVCQAYNLRARSNELPVLELGLGIAFQNSAPHYWADGESRIMISAALNTSDRLASCSKLARRLMSGDNNLFRVFYFQCLPPAGMEELEEQFFFRYNVMGVALDQEGFQKVQEEISLSRIPFKTDWLGRKEEITLYRGTVPIGNGFEKLIIREAQVPRLRLPGGQLEEWTGRRYYEACVNPKLYEQLSETQP